MAIQVALNHITSYRYDRLVHLAPHVVRLRPAPHTKTRIVSYSQTIDSEHFINWQQDPFANYQARLVFPKPMRMFTVTVDLVVEMAVHNPFDFFLEPSAETFPFSYDPALQTELAPYLDTVPLTPLLSDWLARIPRTSQATVDFLVGLNQQLHHDICYTIRMEPGVQTPEETLRKASGSCRDSGWLLVQVLRHLGLAARFASGYLIQLTPDVKAVDGPSGPAADFTDLHAWCEVYLPGAGWIGLDPTSGLLAGEGHIPLACTPHPSSAAPISGALDECEVTFEHHMQVSRIAQTPRVTAPYTDAQWQAIVALGHQVDRQLQADDVRLTMGGEPTFVATQDRDAPEWNTDALGPTKRDFGKRLLDKLYAQYGQGGLIHLGQGKWYPGEQLPRWALSLCWRKDGQAIWRNPALLAHEADPAQHSAADAQRFAQTLAQHLGVSDAHIQTAYEDTWYYLWRERRLPVNVDPLDAKLDDELERMRLRRVFSQGLDAVVGYVLPLSTHTDARGSTQWQTGPWFVRDERMYLVPGDSPMGYRLPLDSLPWQNAVDRVHAHAHDPFAPQAPLAPAPLTLQAVGRAPSSQTLPKRGQSAMGLVRTALCVEARDPQRANGPKAEHGHGGRSQHLYVFMPPLTQLEAYLALVSAVEDTAAQLNMPVILEGYPPPRDPRLNLLQITPDPGVVEVNIHPARNWDEIVAHTTFLYDAAHQTHLCAEKFMTDGRHTGTGGGNHMVLGGATPEDSPFLRRPDLLASMLRHWHNHPSLSYLFSGLFIGPTSQAPRVDEARNDQLHELEIALQQIQQASELHGNAMPPWSVDRTLRNVLIDVTGNTHRSEFCIDKLYAPEGPTGRLGLLELRGFEMPPHARMSVAQQLLIRALIARFWRQPTHTPLTRWGTQLHDRFMLSTWVRQDFADVLRDLAEHGFDLDLAWFEPHFNFRFPAIGRIHSQGITVDLRHALEPWHVMGEEGAGSGTVRYVDASLERIEVLVQGFNPERYLLTVNGRALPLHPTGTEGAFVAGVRFKAWNLASSLHPSIGVHAPLTFDIVDTWHQRSVGGAQYHVAHPGGRNYQTAPINAFEAESRRLSRFLQMGHTPGTVCAEPTRPHREFPFTLDLRHARGIGAYYGT